ncbi:hypothetical protein POTOM_025085 [Populus tomentosa]|uniref:Uncharacterized protein n=1 Tax=Populus tomentosa TaxID=118781 RepID=A0A8X8CWQ9_POPTO|nr:hypothetical protein POTOM_025085 [Populus tomentosa]
MMKMYVVPRSKHKTLVLVALRVSESLCGLHSGEPQAIDAPAHKNDRPKLEDVYDDDDYVRVACFTVVINSEETRKRNSGVGLTS